MHRLLFKKLKVFSLIFVVCSVQPITAKKEKTKVDAERLERIRSVLKYGHSEQVRKTLRKIPTLPKSAQKKLVKDIRNLLSTEDLLVQVAIIRYIKKASFSDLDKDSLILYNAKHATVLFSLLSLCREKNIKSIQSKLEEFIKDFDFTKEDNKFNEIMLTLQHFDNSSLTKLFVEKLKSDDTTKHNKMYIIRYFGAITKSTDEVKAYLLEKIKDEDEDLSLRITCIKALGKLKYKKASADFLKELDIIESWTDIDKKRSYSRYRFALIVALSSFGNNKVKKTLTTMTKSDDQSVRIRAIRQLGELKDKGSIGLLEFKAKYDTNNNVRKAAQKAIDKIRGKKVDEKISKKKK